MIVQVYGESVNCSEELIGRNERPCSRDRRCLDSRKKLVGIVAPPELSPSSSPSFPSPWCSLLRKPRPRSSCCHRAARDQLSKWTSGRHIRSCTLRTPDTLITIQVYSVFYITNSFSSKKAQHFSFFFNINLISTFYKFNVWFNIFSRKKEQNFGR